METSSASPLTASATTSPNRSDDDSRRSRELIVHLKRSETYLAYEEAFQAATGLPLALRAVGTLQSPLREAKNANPFCVLMAQTNRTCAGCLQLQQRVEESSSRETATQECYAGLVESTVPILVGEKVIAYLQTGQIMLRRPSAAQFRRAARQWKQWGVELPAAEVERAYFQSKVLAKPQYNSILRLLAIFAEHLSALVNQLMTTRAKAELPAVARARSFIAERQTEEIALGDVAKAVNMSAFYFCKIFRKVTGVTFVEYLARLRIEGVKKLLLDPHKRISEAAFEAGFQSLSQFNRVFRRIAGEAPTDYRERLHGPAQSGPRPLVFAA